jgi:hypothetical protein
MRRRSASGTAVTAAAASLSLLTLTLETQHEPPPPPPGSLLICLLLIWSSAGQHAGSFAGTGRVKLAAPVAQGLTLAHFRAQLEDLRDTSLTSELNLSTFGTHPLAHLGYVGDKVSLN